MPESQLVKNSEQKSQDYLTEKIHDGKSFLKNQRIPASLAFIIIIIIIIIIIKTLFIQGTRNSHSLINLWPWFNWLITSLK